MVSTREKINVRSLILPSNELIHLSDYFQPFTLKTSLLLLTVLFYFDLLGFWVRKKVLGVAPPEYRVLDWLIGLATFVFEWFCLGFFIPPTEVPLALSALITIIPLAFFYKREGAGREIVSTKRDIAVVALLLGPLIPAVFVRASLPPYYSDEMAYHFISPAALQNISTWKFTEGLYGMLPRLVDTLYLLCFSLAKTQIIGRSIHFLILTTSLVFSVGVLKSRFGPAAALLFVASFLSLPQVITFTSTLGFVDVASYSFILLGTLLGVVFLREGGADLMILSGSFWAMALGTKYTGLTCFSVFIFIFAVSVITDWKKFQPVFTRSNCARALLASCGFGGYWYIKNLILTGNPIYPFIFPCYRWKRLCGSGSSFFGSWTLPITVSNLPTLFAQLFDSQRYYYVLLGLSVMSLLLPRLKNSRNISLSLVLLSGGELLLLSRFSGFLIRYQQHIQLILLLMVAIALGTLIQSVQKKSGRLVLAAVILLPLAKSYRAAFLEAYTPFRAAERMEVSYALGKRDIFDFITYRMPKALPLLTWCDNPPGGKKVGLVRYDPDLIWYDDAAYMHQFFTNCYFEGWPLAISASPEEIIHEAKTKKLNFYLLSINRCMDPGHVIKKVGNEDTTSLMLRKLNNFLVCHSREVFPNYVYQFDYHNF